MQADGHGKEPQGLGSNRRETTYRPKPKEASGRPAPWVEKIAPQPQSRLLLAFQHPADLFLLYTNVSG
jgi:hypothetical protein